MACTGFLKWRRTETRNTPDSIYPLWLLVDIIFLHSQLQSQMSNIDCFSFSITLSWMDFSEISIMLRLKEAKQVVRKSVELCRISDLQFNSSNAVIVSRPLEKTYYVVKILHASYLSRSSRESWECRFIFHVSTSCQSSKYIDDKGSKHINN